MNAPGTPDRETRRRLLTVYGRKAVLEALEDSRLDCRILHLADSNRPGGTMAAIEELARRRALRIRHHSRTELARISRNGKQDQGVAVDVFCPAFSDLDSYLSDLREGDTTGRHVQQHILALDGVTNPQNMGMALRSAAAAGLAGFLYADRGNPALGPLVIKASAGVVFRAPLLRCRSIADAARKLTDTEFTLYRLQAGASRSLWETRFPERSLFVLGGESEGLSDALRDMPGEDLSIPMAAGVESLNVAVSASLVAFAAQRAGAAEQSP